MDAALSATLDTLLDPQKIRWSRERTQLGPALMTARNISGGSRTAHMRRALVAVTMLCSLAGCAGARTTIVADDTRFPVSLSEGMRAPDGHLLEPMLLAKPRRPANDGLDLILITVANSSHDKVVIGAKLVEGSSVVVVAN